MWTKVRELYTILYMQGEKLVSWDYRFCVLFQVWSLAAYTSSLGPGVDNNPIEFSNHPWQYHPFGRKLINSMLVLYSYIKYFSVHFLVRGSNV